MSERLLRSSSGSPAVDGVLRALIGRYERTFPGLIGGYYLIGSYADASAQALAEVEKGVL